MEEREILQSLSEKNKYPVGIQTFSEIRENGYVYVDKTEYIYNLVTRGKYYFLSRPRRFGKSLLLSTIEALFRGRRDLFDGLFIGGKEWEWVEYPVFHLALNGQYYNHADRLDEVLHNNMEEWENHYNLPKGNTTTSVATRFFNCIRNAYEATGQQAIILIDEYDQPLLQNIEQGRENLHQELREQLQAFYSVMKVQDRYIRFAMLSGISKFGKTSVFSGLNNLQDITLETRANAICGISESELESNFAIGIARLADANGMSTDETRKRLKKEYDGYHFAKSGEGIYNPFSLLNTFENDAFSHYWVETGTPSFLISILKERNWNLSKIPGCECSGSDLKGSDRYLSNPIPLLFQSGYLTIKGYDLEFDDYILDYPNEEVAEGFTNDLLDVYSDSNNTSNLIKQFVRYVREGEAEAFMTTLQSLFADIPYDQIPNRELHYENIMYLVMKLMGFYAHTEYKTSDGRIDMIVSTDRYIYVMEFKLHGTAEDAMAQIHKKEYYLPFRKEGKRIVLIGASFCADKRCLDSWQIKKL